MTGGASDTGRDDRFTPRNDKQRLSEAIQQWMDRPPKWWAEREADCEAISNTITVRDMAGNLRGVMILCEVPSEIDPYTIWADAGSREFRGDNGAGLNVSFRMPESVNYAIRLWVSEYENALTRSNRRTGA